MNTCYIDENGNVWMREYLGNGEARDTLIYENTTISPSDYYKPGFTPYRFR